MTSKFHISNAFRDGTTRLVVPDISITVFNALTSLASSFIENPQNNAATFFTKSEDNLSTDRIMRFAKDFVNNLLDILTIGLGVTKIETSQDYVMPFSKGIGSTGEIIHLLGARNEIINLEFKTDRYPGRLGYIIKRLLQKIFEDAVVVYVIDDLFLSTPCLIRRMSLSKEGKYRGAVMGELELVSLSTGNNFANSNFNLKEGLKKFAGVVKAGIKSKAGAILTGAVAVGSFRLGADFVNDIVRGDQ